MSKDDVPEWAWRRVGALQDDFPLDDPLKLLARYIAAQEQQEPDAPKLLTEAEAVELWELAQQSDPTTFVLDPRVRGLIKPEPVDALLIEAREIVASRREADVATAYRLGKMDKTEPVEMALAALRRGMELTRGVTVGGDGA